MPSSRPLACLISLALAAGCASAFAADPAPAVADKPMASALPFAKTNSAADRKTLAAVRRAVVKDKSLSVSAHNVKMKIDGGVVTLRGGVKSAEEKDKVEALAKSVAGVSSVDNQLTLKGEKTARATTTTTAPATTSDTMSKPAPARTATTTK